MRGQRVCAPKLNLPHDRLLPLTPYSIVRKGLQRPFELTAKFRRQVRVGAGVRVFLSVQKVAASASTLITGRTVNCLPGGHGNGTIPGQSLTAQGPAV